MPITKAEVRSTIRDMIDDPNAKRWTNASLDRVVSRVIDDVWTDILDTAPYIVSQYQQLPLPLHTPGYVDLRLTDFGGDLIQRMYRIQQVIADGRHYFPKDPRDYLMTASSNTGDITTVRASSGVEQAYSFQFLGDQMWLHPLGQVTTFVELRYNYRPVEYLKMTDGLNIAIPEGSDSVVTLLTAAQAMPKGGAEDGMQFKIMGEEARDKMLNSIRRQYHGMTVPFTTQNPWEFGGV